MALTHSSPPGMIYMRSATRSAQFKRALCALLLPLCLAGCGDTPVTEVPGKALDFVKKLKPQKPNRPCFDHEECFAGEYCAEGFCAPYNGVTTARPVNQYDQSAYEYDLGTPDMPD